MHAATSANDSSLSRCGALQILKLNWIQTFRSNRAEFGRINQFLTVMSM